MEYDHEEHILRNPALTARAFWHFARSYSDYGGGRTAELPQFLLGAAMVFHEATVEHTHRMQFETGLHKAVSECPDMLLGLQARLNDSALPALRGLQTGTSAGILRRVDGGSDALIDELVGVTLTAMSSMPARCAPRGDLATRRCIERVVFEVRTEMANITQREADECGEPPLSEQG